MAYLISATAPSVINVAVNFTDPITTQSFQNIVTNVALDDAITFVNTNLANTLTSNQLTYAEKQESFLTFVNFLFVPGQVVEITNLYSTVQQMLSFMNSVSTPFFSFGDATAQKIGAFAQQFIDTGATLGLNTASNIYATTFLQ